MLTRDVAALGVLLAMPMLLIFILASAFGGIGGEGGDIDARVAIVNLDAGAANAPGGAVTPVGDEVTAQLTGSETVSGIFAIEQRDDAEEVRSEVERGDMLAALIIPEEFTASIAAGDPIELEVLKDPGSELTAGIWESIVRSVAADISRVSIIAQTASQSVAQSGGSAQAAGAAAGIAAQEASAEDAQRAIVVEQVAQAQDTQVDLAGKDFYSLSMTSMFLVFGAMFGAFGFITERREKTMSRLLTTPTAHTEYIGGKMLAIFVLGMVQFTILYVFTRFAYGVQWGDDPLATFSVAAAMLVAVTGLAVLIASLAKSERGAGGFGSLIVQIMALIGGVFFPIAVLPEWLRPIRYFSIMGWGLEGFQDIQIHGAGLADVMVPILALIGMGLAFFLFGVWRLGAE